MTEFLLLIIAAGIGVLIFRKPGTQFELPVRIERFFQTKRPPEIITHLPPAPPVSPVSPVSPQIVAPGVTPTATPPNKAAAVVLMILAMAYVIFPFDPLPDFIPFLGWIDDIGVFMAARKNLVNAMKVPDMPV